MFRHCKFGLLVSVIAVAGCSTHRELETSAATTVTTIATAAPLPTVAGLPTLTTPGTPTTPGTLVTPVIVTSPPPGQTLPPLVPVGTIGGGSATSVASLAPAPSTTVRATASTVPGATVTTTTTKPVTTQAPPPQPQASSCPKKGSTGGVSRDAGTLSSLVGADIRAGLHECFERIVIELKGDGAFPGFSVQYAGSSLVISVGASMGGGGNGYSGPTDIFPGSLQHIKELKLTSDSGGQMTWTVSLDEQRRFTVARESSPARLVIDVQS
jgi:hypothetical protein